MKAAWIGAAQIVAISALYAACDRLVHASHLPLPSNILALGVLLLALSSGLVKTKWIDRGATVLVTHIVAFYAPITAAVLRLRGLGAATLTSAVAVAAISTIVVLAVTGHVAQLAKTRDEP
jgi:holin-like protein